MSSRPVNQLWVVGSIMLAITVIVGIVGLFPEDEREYWKAVSAFLTPSFMEDYEFVGFLVYLFGTIVITGGIIAILTNLLRTAGDRFLDGTANYKFHNHTLFLGYDELMIGTLKQELSLEEKNKWKSDIVVAVPKNAAAVRNAIYQHLSNDYAKHVFVIQSSRIKVDDLKKVAQVITAKKVFIIGQSDEDTHDALNLKSLGLIAALCSKQSGEPKPCMYYLRNQSTFYLIHRLEFEAKDVKESILEADLNYDEQAVELFVKASEPFNFHESIARHIIYGSYESGKQSLQLNAAKGNPHLIIYGMTPMGINLMRDVLMTQHFPERRTRITMIDNNAQEKMHFLIGRHRPFFENCHFRLRNFTNPSQDFEHKSKLNFLDVDVEFIQADMAHYQLTDDLREYAKTEGASLSIAICTDDSPQNMALAIYMPREVFEAKVPIWVYQTGDNSMNAFVDNEEKDNRYRSISIFSTMDYGVSDREESRQWKLAKIVGDDYAKKHPYKDNYNWKNIQPKDRWSSLYGALSKLSMLRFLGKELTPILLTAEETEALCIAEHNRWTTEKLLNGWEPGETKSLFVHDKIVPYDKLSQDSKNKDKEQIEAVVNALNSNKL